MADEKRRQQDQSEGSEQLSDQEFAFQEDDQEDEEGFAISEEETSGEGEETAA